MQTITTMMTTRLTKMLVVAIIAQGSRKQTQVLFLTHTLSMRSAPPISMMSSLRNGVGDEQQRTERSKDVVLAISMRTRDRAAT